MKDLNHGQADKRASVLLVTIWEFGEAAGPLFIGPLSEVFGRRKVLNIANVLFIAATILAACSQDIWVFIGARWLTGAAVTANVLNPAIIGDIFEPEERGSAMSMVVLAPLLGGAIGPAISGLIAESLGWRAVLWMAVGLATVCEIALLFLLRETYHVTILRERTRRLRDETGNKDLVAVCDMNEDGDEIEEVNFWRSITRPFPILFNSPVLMGIALFGSMTFTWYYIVATNLPGVLENKYGLSPADTGLCFISFSAGSAFCIFFCNRYIDRIYSNLKKRHGGIGLPEYKLPFVIVGGISLPLVIIGYGWAIEWHWPLPVLLTLVGLFGAALMCAYVPLIAYTVDAFGKYSASGVTATIVTRCLAGTIFPLTTDPLVERFGYGWGLLILAVVSMVLAPIPILAYRYGHKWRQGSKYTRDN